ncbi:MAG: TRAP transporter fused permease subunit [Synergistaceae bacterium]|jgi:TRAP transporter 4TM/12TM fusion protein|nr:TRAP transporter fused permease subunit [Synergistaceae bacterium]
MSDNAAPQSVLNPKICKALITIVGLVMVLVHMVYAQTVFITSELYLTLHMAFSFSMMFLLTIQKSKSRIHTVILLVSVVLCFVFVVYIAVNLEMLRVRAWSSTTMDIVVGLTMICLAMYSSWLGYGAFIPLLVLACVIYPFFGKNLPEPFKTTSYSVKRTISNMSIGLKTGLYDSTITISANYVFLFSVFGGLLSATGVQKFFYELGNLLVGRFRSGTAQITSFNTALVGMVVGSAVANVSITGPYCIDAMRKSGYGDVESAAILAVGANGGQIMPPVMGIIAFAMAGFSGVPYWNICKMAIIPALLYYGALSLYAHLVAMKNPVLRVKKIERPQVDMDIIKYRSLSFFVPFVLIIYMLAKNNSVMTCAFWAIIAVIITSYIAPKRYRPSFRQILNGFIDGAISGVQVGCICAIIGMLVATFTASGLGIKLTSGIEGWSAGNLFIALLILYFASIVAGMAGVSVAAYFTAAAFAVPALIKMGVPFVIAHFFIVYPASFSTITPPVALASLVASRIAGTKYGPTAIESCKVASVAFLTPFLFVYAPGIVLLGDPSNIWSWLDVALVVMMTIASIFCWVGHFMTGLNFTERSLFFVSTCAVAVFLILRNPVLCAVSVITFFVGIIVQLYKSWKFKTMPTFQG